MKIAIALLIVCLSGCAVFGPKAENNSGLDAQVKSVRHLSEDLVVTVAFHNTTKQPMRLESGAVTLLLPDEVRIKGKMSEPLKIAPGQHKEAKMEFHYFVPPDTKTGFIELQPSKVFHSCKIADADPSVVKDDEDKRNPATEGALEADNCDRFLKDPIRIAY
jgi:hypothetical protein